jgi:hypothetical protein
MDKIERKTGTKGGGKKGGGPAVCVLLSRIKREETSRED